MSNLGGGGEKKAMKNLRAYTHRFDTPFRPVIVMRIELLRNQTSIKPSFDQ